MDKKKLSNHIKLCLRNLKDSRIKCCASCPFEEEIVSVYPETESLFEEKRREIKRDTTRK